MALTDRNLKGGEKLTAAYKGKVYTCDVMKEDGKLIYIFGAGGKYTSPSAAGSAVRGGKATNGWAFWSLEGTEPVRKADENHQHRRASGEEGDRRKRERMRHLRREAQDAAGDGQSQARSRPCCRKGGGRGDGVTGLQRASGSRLRAVSCRLTL